MPLAVLGVVAVAVIVALIVVVAPRASSSPDGLEKVSADHGIDANVRDSATADSPFADYGTDGLSGSAATIVAGLVGAAITFALVAGGLALVRRRRGPSAAEGVPAGASVGP